MSETSGPGDPLGDGGRTWDSLLAEVEERHVAALTADVDGGRGGAPSARDRLRKLLDPDTFEEIGVLASTPVRGRDGRVAGSRPGGTVCGLGGIDGRLVAVAAEGPLQEPTAPVRKSEKPKSGWDGYIERLALEYRIPLVLLLDGYGGSNSYAGNKGYPYLLSGTRSETLFRLLDQSPVLVGVTGPVAGVTSGRVAASHFSVMAQGGRVFAGSAMAAAALDEETATRLGGPRMQAIRSGTVDNVAVDEDDLFAQIRTVLSYLPTNVDEEPPFLDVGDAPDRSCDELLDIVPDNRRRPFNAQQMIEAVVDDGSFFELAPGYGRALVAGLARVAGQAVGVFSSNPYVNAGAMDLPACEKQTRVAELCDTFHLPMVYFADVPGFMIGIEAERSGLMRRGVRAMQAIHRSTVPVVTIQVRRSYGLAGNATGAPNRLSVKIAWPLGEWGDMPIEGGVDALFRRELEASDDPAALRDRIETRMQAAASIWGTAESFGVEDIIDPRDTRRVLSRWIAASTAHRRVGPKQGPQVRP